MYENNITRFYKNEENIDLIKDFEIWFEKNYEVFNDDIFDLHDMFAYTSPENLFQATTSWCAFSGNTPSIIAIHKEVEEVRCFSSEKDFNKWQEETFVYWIEDLLTVKFKQLYNTYDEYTLQVMRIVYTWDYYKTVNLINDMIESNEGVIEWIKIHTQ